MEDIERVFGDISEHKPVFCYGKMIYNPYKREILADTQVHEQVHARQQGEYPKVWWYKYLTDVEFRKQQEIEAYGIQYEFAKSLTSGKLRDFVLDSITRSLVGGMYGIIISHGEARSKIRNFNK